MYSILLVETSINTRRKINLESDRKLHYFKPINFNRKVIWFKIILAEVQINGWQVEDESRPAAVDVEIAKVQFFNMAWVDGHIVILWNN